jgi:hypothetical protein
MPDRTGFAEAPPYKADRFRSCRQVQIRAPAADARPAVLLLMRTPAATAFDDSLKLAYISVLDKFMKQLR